MNTRELKKSIERLEGRLLEAYEQYYALEEHPNPTYYHYEVAERTMTAIENLLDKKYAQLKEAQDEAREVRRYNRRFR